jgi:serine/threonine protein kinase
MSNDATRTIGQRYAIHEEKAEGSFGVVFSAIDTKTGAQVAVKRYTKKSSSYIPMLDQFIRSEIKIMKLISHEHENLVTLYDHIEDDDYHFLVMEYCQLGQLEDKYEEHKTFPEQQCAKYFTQLARAVSHMHARKIIHRDLQLSNVCLTETDDIRVCDFGLAQLYNEKEYISGFRGSSMYALPDSLLGKDYDPVEVDIWSLGCCLYKLLTGYLPFRNIQAALTGQFMIPLDELDISDDGKDLVRGILRVDEERFDLAKIMSHPWFMKYMVGEEESSET